jgi:nicotinamide-nucleotide amidase
VPGSSEILDEAIVTYSNNAKSKRLGVKEETLESFGAVSKQTAYEMAEGIARFASSDIGIAITGIAGPGGGTDKKPVGTVFTAVCFNGETNVYHLLINGSRDEVREETCRFVFERLDELLS